MKTPTLAAIAASLGIVLLAGCGQPPATSESTPATPPPTPTPAPESASSPLPIPPPEATPPAQPKILYVTTEFRAVSQLGTHEFPVGTEVELLEVVGEEYLVQKGDVAVRIHRTYFSEKAPATTEPSPSPTPDEISLAPAPPAAPSPAPAEPGLFSPEPQPTPPPLETPKPAGQLSPEEQRISELTESIRQVDDRLREARQSGSKAEAEKLKRKRDELSEELTTLGKP